MSPKLALHRQREFFIGDQEIIDQHCRRLFVLVKLQSVDALRFFINSEEQFLNILGVLSQHLQRIHQSVVLTGVKF